MIRRASIVFAAFCANACTVDQPLRMRDDFAIMPSVRVAKTVLRSDDSESSTFASQLAVEGAIDYANGDGNSSTPGDYSMIQATVGVRGGTEIVDRFRVYGLGGIAAHRADVDFDASTGGPSTAIKRDEQGLGLMAGLQLEYDLAGPVTLYGRATYSAIEIETESRILEAGVKLEVTEELNLFAGYRHWRYRFDGDPLFFLEQSIDLTTEGLLLGGEINF